MFVADRLATLAVAVASRIDLFYKFVLKVNKKNTHGLLFVAYTLTGNKKKINQIQRRGEENNEKKSCIKVETLVVITQTIDPTRDTPFKKKNNNIQKQLEEIVCERLCLTCEGKLQFQRLVSLEERTVSKNALEITRFS